MEKEFRYLDLGLASRLVLAAAIFAAGLALQVAVPALTVPGLVLVVAGWIPLFLRPATNKPDDQGHEDWRPVTIAEIDRLDDGIRASNKLKWRTMSKVTGIAIAIGLPVAFITIMASLDQGRKDVAFVVANAALLLVPGLFFGRIRVFVPGDIAFKMPSFRAVLSEELPSGVVVAPYIRFDKDSSGADVPEDLRLMLELKRPPADLVGIQIQAAVNKGPNGNVPYLYAVVLTRGMDGPSYAAARRLKARGYEVEAGGEGDYGSVVVRQATSGTGYNTTPDDCRRLARLCVSILEKIAA